MQYVPMTKFHASVAANGDITPGAAYAGFMTTTLDHSDFGVFHILLEDPVANTWEMWRYDATAVSGSRETRMYSSDVNGNASIALPAADLCCSLVAHPNSYLLSTHDHPGDTQPLVRSLSSTGVGAGADIGIDSPYSLAVSGAVKDTSPRSVVIGGCAGDIETTSVGYEASAETHVDTSTYATISAAGSVALGYRAKTMAAGEVALGNANMSHMSGVPIMTDPPFGGGTFVFKAVGGYNDTLHEYTLSDIPLSLGPLNTAASPDWIIHVQGIISARATDAANNKVVKVEWVTGGTLTQNVLTQGANNISLGLALSGEKLQVTVAATEGLSLTGYLHVTKIAYQAV